MSTDHMKPEFEDPQVGNDDDEFDELDDVLGEFDRPEKSVSSCPPSNTTKLRTTSGNRPRNNTRVDAPPISTPGTGPKLPITKEEDDLNEDELRDDFTRELAKGMEELVKEITNGIAIGSQTGASSSEATGGSGDKEMTDEERTQAIKSAWEAMLIEGMNGTDDGSSRVLAEGDVRPKTASENTAAPPNDFQTRIQQAMNKLKESESNLRPDSTSFPPGETPQSFETLLNSLNGIGLGEDEGDEEFTSFLETMMGQLTSKEMLYDPLKELATNFPEYLAKPPKPLDPKDKERYEQQYSCIQQVIAVYEKTDYTDANPQYNQTVVELMTKIQSYGQPPSELLGELPPGFDGGLFQAGNDCVIA